MAKYVLTNKAVEDLSKIWHYTYETWSENQADKYYKLIIATCQEIAKKPTMGKSYVAIASELLGIKIGKHIIFYRQRKPNEIEVVRILHVSMDLKKRMEE